MKNREQIIQEIEYLFPADSKYPSTREVGEGLLQRAIWSKWRSLPDEILLEYLRLCREKSI